METKRKSNSVVTVQQTETGLTFNVIGAGEFTLDMGKLHSDVLQRAAFHGMKQRIADAAAIARDQSTGQSASPTDKYAAMKALADHYMTGTAEWSRRGEGGGGAKSITIEAIARVQGVDYATAEDAVNRLAMRKFDNDRAAALRELSKSPKVQSAIAAIRAERIPKSDINADALLTELE